MGNSPKEADGFKSPRRIGDQAFGEVGVLDSRVSGELDWESVEEFISSTERQSYSQAAAEDFFAGIAGRLSSLFEADSVCIVLACGEELRPLALQGKSREADPLPWLDAEVQALRPGETRCSARDSGIDGVQISTAHAVEQETVLAISVIRPETSRAAVQQVQEVLGTVAVVCGNFHLRNHSRELRAALKARERVSSMVTELAAIEESRSAASELCRCVQATLGVDRVSLVRVRGGRGRLVATSASSTIARRSVPVQLLERLITGYDRQERPLEIIVGATDADAAVPADLRPLVDRYVDETTVRLIRGIGISEKEAPSAPGDYLILEHFSADWPAPEHRPAVELAVPHARDAARRLLSGLDRSLFRRMTTWGRSGGVKWLLLIAFLGLTSLVLAMIPKDFEISADGTLMPVRRSAVFAPTEAIVEEIRVRHGDSVGAGETLVVLRNPEMEIEERRISGEMATVRSRLESIKAARIRNRVAGSRQQSDAELSAQESDLQTQWDGLSEQLGLLHKQRELLRIKAPIAGRVDRWDLNQAFGERPVVHGQFLFDVLDVEGPWRIELQIPDEVVGYVLDAHQNRACPVSYLYRTAPEKKYRSVIEQISNSTRVDADGKPVVRARVPISQSEPEEFRVGASVLAKIDCGERPLGFVLFREVIEFFQRTFWI